MRHGIAVLALAGLGLDVFTRADELAPRMVRPDPSEIRKVVSERHYVAYRSPSGCFHNAGSWHLRGPFGRAVSGINVERLR